MARETLRTKISRSGLKLLKGRKLCLLSSVTEKTYGFHSIKDFIVNFIENCGQTHRSLWWAFEFALGLSGYVKSSSPKCFIFTTKHNPIKMQAYIGESFSNYKRMVVTTQPNLCPGSSHSSSLWLLFLTRVWCWLCRLFGQLFWCCD